MKAAPEIQRQLLELQRLDTSLTQLAHRRDHLGELAQLAQVAEQDAELATVQRQAADQLAEFDKQIKALERDIDQLKSRASKDQTRMDSGAVPAKELEGLAHEISTLAAKQSELEDLELELMEAQESAAKTVAELNQQVAELGKQREELSARRDDLWQQIDAEIAATNAGRAALLADLPAELLALYQRVLAKSGVGAALLRARRCEGCRLELSGTELAAATAAEPDEVIRHEECGAILIRTEESGL